MVSDTWLPFMVLAATVLLPYRWMLAKFLKLCFFIRYYLLTAVSFSLGLIFEKVCFPFIAECKYSQGNTHFYLVDLIAVALLYISYIFIILMKFHQRQYGSRTKKKSGVNILIFFCIIANLSECVFIWTVSD